MKKSGMLKTKDNHKLAYHYYDNNRDKVVVIVHGFYNSKDSELLTHLSEEMAKEYDVFIFDFRGHGKSSGVFTWTAKESQDLKTVLEYLEGKYEKTAVIAFSLGGTISLNVLSENEYKVDSFICVSAPSDCSKIDYKLWKLDWENDVFYSLLTNLGRRGKGARIGAFWLKKQKPIDNVAKLKVPVLYIHGDKDWVVGHWHSEELFKRTTVKKKLEIIQNAPHAEYMLRKYSKQFYDIIHKWFLETF